MFWLKLCAAEGEGGGGRRDLHRGEQRGSEARGPVSATVGMWGRHPALGLSACKEQPAKASSCLLNTAHIGPMRTPRRCDAYATEFDLEAEEYVPLPKGDVHKRKEIVQASRSIAKSAGTLLGRHWCSTTKASQHLPRGAAQPDRNKHPVFLAPFCNPPPSAKLHGLDAASAQSNLLYLHQFVTQPAGRDAARPGRGKRAAAGRAGHPVHDGAGGSITLFCLAYPTAGCC